jgi:hypothetical protein
LFRGSERPVAGKSASIELAAGRAFTFDVVGESRFQSALSKLCGGKKAGGHKQEAIAHLQFEPNSHDPNAIAVDIGGMQVGWIPATLTPEIRREIAALSPTDGVTCKAKLSEAGMRTEAKGISA